MTDANGDQMTKFMDFDDVAKIALFSLNMAHSDEHQENMVTYLQIKELCRRPAKIRRGKHRSKPRGVAVSPPRSARMEQGPSTLPKMKM